MAENEHTIVGVTRAVAIVKRPDPMPDKPEDAQLFVKLLPIGRYGGEMIALVAPADIPLMRKLGGEVTVVDADGNDYAARVMAAASAADLVASLDETVAKAKADLAIAQAGTGGDGGKA
jgi:hypothetical protein